MTVRVEASGGDRRGGVVIGEGGVDKLAGREFGVWTIFRVRGWRSEQGRFVGASYLGRRL